MTDAPDIRLPSIPGLPVDPKVLQKRIETLLHVDAKRFGRLWAYYRNPLLPTHDRSADRPYRQGQEWGLPPRITGVHRAADPLTPGEPLEGVARKEVVVENDIQWRVDTMVDYLFGQPIVIDSTAANACRGSQIGTLLRMILARAGGITLLQQLALIGAVYGFVDVVVTIDTDALREYITNNHSSRPPVAPADQSPACGVEDLGQPTIRRDEPSPAARGLASPSTRRAAEHTDAPEQSTDRSADSYASNSFESSDDPASSEPASPSNAARTCALDEAANLSPSQSDDVPSDPDTSAAALDGELTRLARLIRIDIVEPTRALPFCCPTDFRQLNAYAIATLLPPEVSPESTASPNGRDSYDSPAHGGIWGRFIRSKTGRFITHRPSRVTSDGSTLLLNIYAADQWMKLENGQVIERGANPIGRVPVAHIQNTALPFEYAGASDVEPLLPLQDELNTRLSDRANRIALQAFKMYLGIGIDNFTSMPVAPGRMWMTDNPDARVVEFGGDEGAGSEDEHVREIREAMDKTSGVTPIAAGAIKGRIGRLTSAAALRVTMLALLARTEKKRTTFGRGIEQICELAMAWLDSAGVFRTDPSERGIRIHWPHPIPANEAEKLQEAEIKARLGVPREVLLRELGY